MRITSLACSSEDGRAIPLSDATLDDEIASCIRKTKISWLDNEEVVAMLEKIVAVCQTQEVAWPRSPAHQPKSTIWWREDWLWLWVWVGVVIETRRGACFVCCWVMMRERHYPEGMAWHGVFF